MGNDAKQSQLAINGGEKVRTKPWPPRRLFAEEEKEAVNRLFDQAIETGNAFGYDGAEEQAFCKEFAESLGGGFADGVNAGTTAVYVALRALDLEPYSEVIVTGLTDPGGFMPIPLLNLIPVVADSTPDSYNTGPQQIEELITPRTGAIVVAHIGGEPADIEGIMAVANKHGIPVIEDCAQAPGATVNGRPVGTFGALGTFSTMFGKHFATGGQGGVVFTRDEELYQRVRWASDRGKPFGLPAGSTNVWASLNFNLGDLPAAIGRVQLKKLPEIVRKRREAARAIAEGIQNELKAVFVPTYIEGADPSYWFFRLGVKTDLLTVDKDTFCRAVIAEGVPLAPRYAAMPGTQDWFKNRRVFGSSRLPWSSPEYKGDADREFPCPNLMNVLDTYFNLSLHENVGPEEVADVIKAFRKVEEAYLK